MSTAQTTDTVAYVRIDLREARRWTRGALVRLGALDEADVPPAVAARIQADITTTLTGFLNAIAIAIAAVETEEDER